MYTFMNNDSTLTDDQIEDMIIEEDLSKYKVDNTIPNYVIDESGAENILKTEVHVCSSCMHPDIIGTVPFNRREKEVRQFKLDSVVFAALHNFAKLNKLDMNATVSLLIRIAKSPEVHKMLMGSFTNMSKRKGKHYRSDKIKSL